MRYTITIEDEIQAAHRLDLPYESPCTREHGHTYKIRVLLGSTFLDENGMVVDFAIVKKLIRRYDHQHLNEFMKQSTAENFAQLLYQEIDRTIRKLDVPPTVLKVSVSETRSTWVHYTERRQVDYTVA